MIAVNERFEFERGQYDWHLHELTPSKDKDGNPSVKRKTSYHPNLDQICKVIIDKHCGDCESLQEIRSLLDNAENLIGMSLKTVEAIRKGVAQQ